MKSKIIFTILAAVFTICTTVLTAHAAMPDFTTPAIYADGEAWATKGVTNLPAPNAHNGQSFDKLYAFSNGANGQLPVAEAAPGNPLYNGGRWNLQMVTWLIMNPPIIMSYDDLAVYIMDGDLVIAPQNTYFECPLLPVK